MVASCYRSNFDYAAAITAAPAMFAVAITATVILTILLLLQQLVDILHNCCRSNHKIFCTAITAVSIWYDVADAATLLFLAVAIAATSCTVAVAATDVN